MTHSSIFKACCITSLNLSLFCLYILFSSAHKINCLLLTRVLVIALGPARIFRIISPSKILNVITPANTLLPHMVPRVRCGISLESVIQPSVHDSQRIILRTWDLMGNLPEFWNCLRVVTTFFFSFSLPFNGSVYNCFPMLIALRYLKAGNFF